MRSIVKPIVFVSAAWVVIAATAFAQDTGATSNGNWNDPTIWTGGVVPNSSNNVYIGSTYPSGTASTATVTLTASATAGSVTLGDGSGTSGTLNLLGNTLAISGGLNLGSFSGQGTLIEGDGSFTSNNVFVQNGNFLAFGSNDGTAYLNLSGGSSATTATIGSVTGDADVLSGSTLTLGADFRVPGGYVNVQDSGSTLDMASHNLVANNFYLGFMGSSTVTLENRGTITATNVWVGNGQSFTFNAADTSSLLYLATGAHVTTAATGNVTTNAEIHSGSTLSLGADMTLAGYLNLMDSGSTFNAQGHALTADTFYVGALGTSSVIVSNLGLVTLNNLLVGNSTTGSDLTLHGGDVVNGQIALTSGSVLTVQQTNAIGLTLNGTAAGDLSIDPSSMDLIFTLNNGPNWDFRWKDPAGANWISTIDSMIGSGQIMITAPDGYSVVDQRGYTYIMGGFSSVPEPSSLVLAFLGTIGFAVATATRRRRTGH